MEQEKAAKRPAKKKGCWPWSKEVIDVPLFDDVNCPYAIKPSELFKINEVGCFAGSPTADWLPMHAV
jgi:hypothetical protein